jgi:hypothetical protein
MVPDFVKYNYGLQPSDVGLTPMQLCACNDFVDKETRMLINRYLTSDIEDEHCTMPEYYKNTYIVDRTYAAIKVYKSKVVIQLPSP